MSGAAPLSALVVPGVVEMVPFEMLSPEREAPLRSATGARRAEGALHEIYTGPLAGHELAAGICGWKDLYTFVVVDDLSLAQRLLHYPRFAAEWRALAGEGDASGEPYRDGPSRSTPRKLLAGATLLLLDDATRPADDPARALGRSTTVRFVEVGFARNADDYFHLRVVRDGAALLRVTGAYHELRAACRPAPDDDDEEYVDRDRFLDRLLVAATGGLASSRAVALAFDLAASAAPRVEAHAVTSDARERAASIVGSLLAAHATNGDSVDVAPYGRAHRVTLAGYTLPAVPRSKRRGALRVEPGDASALVVPDETVWIVSGLAAPAHVAQPSTPPTRPPPAYRSWAKRRRVWAAALLAAVVVAALLFVRYRKEPLGGSCWKPKQCASRMCIIPFGDRVGYCSHRCTADDQCANDLVCKTVPGSRLCMLREAR